jgi:hypothetical protein
MSSSPFKHEYTKNTEHSQSRGIISYLIYFLILSCGWSELKTSFVYLKKYFYKSLPRFSYLPLKFNAYIEN